MPSTATRRLRRLAALGAGVLAVLIGACAAIADPSVRVVERDVAAGGPPGVALGDLTPLFDDPDVVDALADLDAGRASAAADTLATLVADHPDHEFVGVAWFALAYARHEQGDHEGARTAGEACIDQAPLFADHCAYFAADAALELGAPEEAEAWASIVDAGTTYGPRAHWLRGRALAASGANDAAVLALTEFLERWPEAWYREDVELDLAEVLIAAGEVDEAARVYHRLVVVHPGEGVEDTAQDALDALMDELSVEVRSDVSNRDAADSLARGQVLFDRHRSDEVIALLTPVVESIEPGSEVACRAAWLVGKSYSKLRQHTNAIPFYERVIDHCLDQTDLRVWSLYNLGRGLWTVDRNDEGFARFEQIYVEHAEHSYADDAMLYNARIKREDGDEAAFAELLHRQCEEFPDGDMLADAVWLQMADAVRAADWRAVVNFADEQGSRTGEDDIYSRGRLAYYRARGLEALSLTAEARVGYTDVIRAHPMGWYALLAFNRLRALDPDAAEALTAELREAPADDDDTGMIRVHPPEVRQDPDFQRGLLLLRAGLYELAGDEFRRLRETWANEDEVGWLLSLLFHRAGAWHISHHVPGERLGLELEPPHPGNRERWEVAYPRPFAEHVEAFAEERGLDPYIVWAIMREESGFRPDIESWANARGLLQLMLPTANDMARETGRGSVTASQLFEPAINIELGTMFMRVLANLFDDHPSLIIGGYNGGQGNVRSWLRARGDLDFDLWVEEIPYSQTRHYVKRVTTTYWIYRWLYADGEPHVDLPFDLSEI